MPPTTDPGAGRPAPSDDELARLAQEGGPPSDAIRALYERLGAVTRRFVARHVALHALPAGEAEDATQELALAFLQAVSRFDPGGSGVAAGDRFRAFLRRVLRDWLSKYERRLRRAERRLDRSKDAAEELDERVLQGEKSSPGGPTGDPAALAVWEEDCSRLEGALGRLGDDERRVWDALADDRKLRAAAREMGCPYDWVKRLRRRLLAGLREAVLGEGSVGRPPRSGGRKPPAAVLESDADPKRPAKAAPASQPGRTVAMTSSAEAFQAASGLHQAGRRGEAQDALRSLPAADPGHAPALHLLGLTAYEEGRADDAVDWFGKAAHAAPAVAFYHSCLGAALQAAGRQEEAEGEHRRALALKPGDGAALNNLGVTLAALGRHGEAEAALRGALAAGPGDAEAWCNLGAALRTQGKADEAEAACREALRLAPGLAEAHTNLGNALQDRGRPGPAESCHRKAVELQPRLTAAWRNLAALLRPRGRTAEAVQAFHEALRLSPGDVEGRVQLGEALLDLNRPGEAEAACREALLRAPNDADAHNGLGNALAALGRLDEAAASYREAARLRPSWSAPVYNLGVGLQGQGRLAEARAAFGEARSGSTRPTTSPTARSSAPSSSTPTRTANGWSPRAVAGPRPTPRRPKARPRTPTRRTPPGACGSATSRRTSAPDETTAGLRALGHAWRGTWGLTDDEVEAQVRQDGIDVLVDLGGHLAHNRLRVFGRRPAPVRLSWLGYAAGTGVPAIDFRLTDAVCDPPGETAPAGEALARLPGPFCCYGPPLHVPQRIGPPSDEAGGVVFGSLHKLEKLNDRVLDLWAQILRDAPTRACCCAATRCKGRRPAAGLWRERLAGRGLPAERVELRHVAPVGLQHLRAYDGIDVALDCFPWSGHTTACEALWMGVPVVTLRGRACAGRMVASVLEAAGLPELVAETPDDYRRVAAGLARDAARRKGLRETLRLRMLRSPLCDKAAFTRGLEEAYRAAWRAWCEKRVAGVAS